MKTSNLRSLTTLELGASKSKSLYYYLWLFLMTTWLLLMFIVQLHHSCSVVEYFYPGSDLRSYGGVTSPEEPLTYRARVEIALGAK